MLIIQIDKDILKSSIWPGNNKETTTKFEALIFLLLHIENSKGDHQITIAGLAKEWCWSRHKVRDFIKNLVKEDRITLYQNGSKIYINKVAKDTRKDSQNDTKKDSQIYCKNNGSSMIADTEKDMVKDIKKDSLELPIDKSSMLEILNMS